MFSRSTEAVPIERLVQRVVAAVDKEWLSPTSHRNIIVLALWDRPDLVAAADVPGVSRLAAAVTSAAARGKAAALCEMAHAADALHLSRGTMVELDAVLDDLFRGIVSMRQALRSVLQFYAAEIMSKAG